MKALLISLSLVRLAAGPDPDRSRVETTSSVPVDMDGCLDHSVKELGMSAKRQEGQRAWTIAAKYLHPTVAKDGTLTVRFEKLERESRVQVVADWPGAPKEKSVQEELEARLSAMTSKMAQLCGVTRPTVKCERTPAGGKAAPCPPRA